MSCLIEDNGIILPAFSLTFCDSTHHTYWKTPLYPHEKWEWKKQTSYCYENYVHLVDSEEVSEDIPLSPNFPGAHTLRTTLRLIYGLFLLKG